MRKCGTDIKFDKIDEWNITKIPEKDSHVWTFNFEKATFVAHSS